MLNYIFLSLTCVISIEIIIKCNLISSVNLIFAIALKIKKLIFSKNISDHWKEQILPAYALQIMRYSLKVLCIFIFTITCILSIDAVLNGFLIFLSSTTGVSASIIISIAYIFVRTQLSK